MHGDRARIEELDVEDRQRSVHGIGAMDRGVRGTPPPPAGTAGKTFKTERERAEAAIDLDVARVGFHRKDHSFLQVFASQFLPQGTPEQWAEFTETQVADGVPAMAELIGLEWPAERTIDVVETSFLLLVVGRGR